MEFEAFGGFEDFEDFGLDLGEKAAAATLDSVERELWTDFLRAPVLDAVVEEGLETRWYGPLQATVVAAQRTEPLLNLLLGAAEPEAVSGGYLERALEWIEELGLDCRIPVDPERPEAVRAEELLNRWGYRRTDSQVRLVRDASDPIFPYPTQIEVIELTEFTEGFGDLLAEGYGLSRFDGWLFDCLPGRHPWRCYVALDEHEWPRAAAAMMVQQATAAHLGFAATAEPFRARGFHRALLARCIRDAIAASSVFVAETTEPLGERDGPSTGCCNLLRTGFHQASVRTTWRREVEPEEDEGDEGEMVF